MHEAPASFISIVVAAVVLPTLAACGESGRDDSPRAVMVSAGELPSCAGDSLRPAAAAPAQGLWVYQRPSSAERVAALIGPARTDGGALAVTRPVESVEVRADGDTIRTRLAAASVTLELLPPLAPTVSDAGQVDTLAGSQPAATYALSARVRLAAYEPCATSQRGPRLRYLRRDSTGRLVTDVMLRRISNE